MEGSRFGFLHRLWFLAFILLTAANLILVSLQLSGLNMISSKHSKSIAYKTVDLSSVSKNVSMATHNVSRAVYRVGASVKTAAISASSAMQNGVATAADSVVSAVVFATNVPMDLIGFASNATHLGALTRPADKSKIPVIPTVATVPSVQTVAQTTAAAVSAPTPPNPPISSSTAQWPIHGAITTYFGAPDWPYEQVHTGIDISDGKSPGITPIKPFKPGVVSEVVHSYSGLGNHITVDHGGGMTSVYGHLSSILVQQGQQVGQNTSLGLEGTTGASTGTHLHFEIRTNGVPVNPKLYINGLP
jgi:murein DD-endopeptidase MepM/ murein hydrolase activator NlpD